MNKLQLFVLAIVAFIMCGCANQSDDVSLQYEKYKLDNGLEVVLHQDTSDPIVSVAILYHVGSNREKPGKTGFAHFFEHMLFQRSENLPRNAFFQKIDALGGTFNGGTWQDGTVYYETVPRDAMEKIFWMESDRMGFFINTVTQGGLEREIDVVSNEKRQYENRPYGMANELFVKNFYPQGHPYSWTVIGEIPDLQSATVDDVKEFYATYYVPANATMVVAGDFDPAQTKELIEKYFGEIAKAPKPAPPTVQLVTLNNIKKISYEDAFANAPMLQISYPGVQMYAEDGYALDFLTELLAGDKKSPFHQVLVEEKKLVPSIVMYSSQSELAGDITIRATTFPGINLNDVTAAVEEAFARFESNEIDPKELDRILTQLETSKYQELTSTLNKAVNMAQNNIFTGDPAFDYIKGYQKVTVADIKRVYEKYVKGKNYLSTSIVPAGQLALAVTGSVPAKVEGESLDQQVLKSQAGAIIDDPYEKSPSQFDRSVEPGLLSNTPAFKVPEMWTAQLSNGLNIRGIEYNELPLIDFTIYLNEGMLLDDPQKPGIANLTAIMLKEGTANKTPSELEDAIGQLGANISINTTSETMQLTGTCLKKNFTKVMALVEEILLHPRWDEQSFEVQKERMMDRIRQNSTRIESIGSDVFKTLLYDSRSILSKNPVGTLESVATITMDNLKNYYAKNITPSIASMVFVGGLTQNEVSKSLSSLNKNWHSKEASQFGVAEMNSTGDTKVFFVDYPGSSQSYILIGKKAMARQDDRAYPATVVNDRLGASSASVLFNILRLERGYTYGAYSTFGQGNMLNFFQAFSNVQGIATKESLELFHDILSTYGEKYTQEDLDVTRTSLLNGMNGAFETPGALKGMLFNIEVYGLSSDYVSKRIETLRSMTLDQAKSVIAKELNYDDMIVIVVGDAKTQLANVNNLNLGKLQVVDKNANPVN